MTAAFVAMALICQNALAQNGGRIVDFPSQRRMVIVVGPVGVDRPGVAAAGIGGRLAQAAMLHRFRAEAIDSAGRPVQNAGAWTVVISGGADTAATLTTMARLDTATRDIVVPEPMGFQLAAADSVLVVASSSDSMSARVYLRLTIDYDPIRASMTRLAVRPMLASVSRSSAGAPDSASAWSWEWTPDVSGRMLVIAGLPLAKMAKLTFVDVVTGEVLWHGQVGGHEAAASADRANDVLALGVSVMAGRVYRLTASHVAPLSFTSASPARAMVLPNRLRPE